MLGRILGSLTLCWAGYCRVRLCVEYVTAESVSAAGRLLQSHTLCWAGKCRVRLCVGPVTAESNSALGRILQSQTLCWASNCGVRFCSGQGHTVVYRAVYTSMGNIVFLVKQVYHGARVEVLCVTLNPCSENYFTRY